ncbi:aldo/keto reductase [Pedobacter sp. UBA4863]|uniref:aldo/keto reductase n=1 Tax=Pedobacter sp. UBA4863 TaxID=1947060 RepID=UPI0025E3964B|nr:aldo/keto reductase [Pedobacter sp. UBA4863]
MKTGKIILGTVQFGQKYGVNNVSKKPNQREVDDMLKLAFNSGIKCLDTAEAYGNAQQVIGKFHKANPTIIFDVIAKLPHVIDSDISIKVDQYLKELRVSRLKVMLFHSFDTYYRGKEFMEQLVALKNQVKIEYIGVSVYTNEQAVAVINDDNVDVIQIPFNLFDNENQRGDLLREAKKKGKIVHTRSVFLQGLFFSDINDNREIVKQLQGSLNTIRELSEQTKVSLQQIALNYCLMQDYIDQILIGVDNISQLQQNIEDLNFCLSDDLVSDINQIQIENSDLLNPSKWNI